MKEFFSRINPTVKGITLAFLATLGMANVYVFSKAALLEDSQTKPPSNISLVIIGILELGSATLLFLAILTIIFVTILGIRFLGERFNAVEAIGILLTIGGVVLISFTLPVSLFSPGEK